MWDDTRKSLKSAGKQQITTHKRVSDPGEKVPNQRVNNMEWTKSQIWIYMDLNSQLSEK